MLRLNSPLFNGLILDTEAYELSSAFGPIQRVQEMQILDVAIPSASLLSMDLKPGISGSAAIQKEKKKECMTS
jgi:hypothetical protein